MDKEDIEKSLNKIIKEAEEFQDNPSNSLALELDKDISILRYIIGEQNFLSLHYFRRMHEEAVKWLDKNYWSKDNTNTNK